MAISKSDLKVRKPPIKPKKDLEPFIKKGQRVKKIGYNRYYLTSRGVLAEHESTDNRVVPLGHVGTTVEKFLADSRFWYRVDWPGVAPRPEAVNHPYCFCYCMEDALIMLEPVED